MSETKRETRTLPVDLTEEEILARATLVGQLDEEIQKLEAKRKLDAKKAKDEIDSKTARRTDLSTQLRTGTEDREVEVYWWPNASRPGQMVLVRTDTGETVDARPETDKDRQRTLFQRQADEQRRQAAADRTRTAAAAAPAASSEPETAAAKEAKPPKGRRKT